jgi:FtsZ-binding cell division protein ZapB
MDRTVPDRSGGDKLSSEELRRKKTSFTLDFASARESSAASKKPKQDFRDGILCSPDVGLLALATPDLERFIMQQAYGAAAAATTPPGAAAATASIVTTPTQVLFPRSVTEEQEAYARGFLDALVELHRQQHQAAASPLLQVVPDHRVGVLPPRASPSDEGQNSLYTNLTPSTRLPPVAGVPGDTVMKRVVQEFSPTPPIPLPGPRPSTLDLSPAARRSVVVSALGVKRFPPFVDDSETLDLSPSGRFANRCLENAGPQKPSNCATNGLTVVVHPPLDSAHNGTTDVPHQLQPSCVSSVKPPETSNQQLSNESISQETLPDLRDQPASRTAPDFGDAILPTRPIDMSVQELAKLERKREKNRHAAQKCRMLKLERIARLQQRVDELKKQNEQFANTAGSLREQVGKLRQLIVEHVEGGCQVMMVRSLNMSTS